ncbi:MAG: peptide ABC transporter permease, partial [Gammaproteobacteria bacterium]|nr:peptide ABC transporter permease [Gammaproteobacteria bacterium]
MGTYILKRLLLIIPTLFFILLINFVVIQIAPGGPVEQAIQQAEAFQGMGMSGGETVASNSSNYQGAKGLSDEMVAKIEAQYGFDKPAHERFWQMLTSYVQLDFGTSFFK